MVDMNVNGVRLATGYEEAISKLGKPSRTKTVIKDNCGEEKVRIIEYPGLQIEFGLYEEQNRHIAQRFVVTSNLWPIGSDIKIGSRLADVVSVFGTPWNNDYNENTESLGYNVVPGNDVGELAFKKGVLVKAHWYINPC